MNNGNEAKVIEKISSVSGIDAEEIEKKIEAKRAKLSGLISREGALQIIAAELGISFDNEKLKINELLPGMRKVNVTGKVINLFPVRTFIRNDQENKVANFIIADDTVSPYGRKITTTEKTGVSVTNSGTAGFVAICDGTNLLIVTTCTSQALTAGNTVTIPAFKAQVGDPT